MDFVDPFAQDRPIGQVNAFVLADPVELVLQMPISAVVTELVDVVGRTCVKALAGISDRKLVAAWMSGGAGMQPRRDRAVRLALQTARVLMQRYDATTVQSWLAGQNPRLERRSAGAMIREIAIGGLSDDQVEQDAKAILDAAHASMVS